MRLRSRHTRLFAGAGFLLALGVTGVLRAGLPDGFSDGLSDGAFAELSQDGSLPAEEGAALVVYVVVDQLRGDLIERYAEVLTGGFARLMSEGYRFTNATFDHAGTATAPGHGTAATGVHPYRHGLVGNSWEEQDADGRWSSVYALRQLSAPIVGYPEMEGRGPDNLLRPGIGDWIRDAHPEARIVSLSGKDRAAIAMAGQGPGEVYWFHSSEGRWVTSTFYRDDYPEWLDRFHSEGMQRTWTETVWESTIPDGAELMSRPDSFPHEGDGVNTYFPHQAALEAGSGSDRELNAWRARVPFLDALNLDLARVAVRELELGRGDRVDYLALPLSQVDRVGHEYGPLSREQMDNLLRLDRELGTFMAFLDEEVGEGRWVLGLTADHGALEIPEARPLLGLPGNRLPSSRVGEMVRAAEAAWESAGGANGEDPVVAARAAAQVALTFDFVEDAFALADVVDATVQPDTFRVFFRNSYRAERAVGALGHLQVGVRLGEGVYPSGSHTGTGHGTAYHYDRHVPLIIMGPGVPADVSEERASVVDLAPTLAHLVGVPFPEDLDGRVLIP